LSAPATLSLRFFLRVMLFRFFFLLAGSLVYLDLEHLLPRAPLPLTSELAVGSSHSSLSTPPFFLPHSNDRVIAVGARYFEPSCVRPTISESQLSFKSSFPPTPLTPLNLRRPLLHSADRLAVRRIHLSRSPHFLLFASFRLLLCHRLAPSQFPTASENKCDPKNPPAMMRERPLSCFLPIR